EAEHARLGVWGDRAGLARLPAAGSIPVLFAEQVARAPEAIAVSAGGHSMSYRALEAAANRLAHRLAGHGVGPGRCVALLMSRSAEAIVAILAVLKTGAAYVAIDPAVPAARLRFVLADAAPAVVLTSTDLAARLHGVDVPIIDVADPALEAQPETGLPAPDPDAIAYLIYTSGTTGTPKGVAITHHNVTALLAQLDAGLPAAGVWTHAHSLAFDVSVWEILAPLLRGG